MCRSRYAVCAYKRLHLQVLKFCGLHFTASCCRGRATKKKKKKKKNEKRTAVSVGCIHYHRCVGVHRTAIIRWYEQAAAGACIHSTHPLCGCVTHMNTICTYKSINKEFVSQSFLHLLICFQLRCHIRELNTAARLVPQNPYTAGALAHSFEPVHVSLPSPSIPLALIVFELMVWKMRTIDKYCDSRVCDNRHYNIQLWNLEWSIYIYTRVAYIRFNE